MRGHDLRPRGLHRRLGACQVDWIIDTAERHPPSRIDGGKIAQLSAVIKSVGRQTRSQRSAGRAGRSPRKSSTAGRTRSLFGVDRQIRRMIALKRSRSEAVIAPIELRAAIAASAELNAEVSMARSSEWASTARKGMARSCRRSGGRKHVAALFPPRVSKSPFGRELRWDWSCPRPICQLTQAATSIPIAISPSNADVAVCTIASWRLRRTKRLLFVKNGGSG